MIQDIVRTISFGHVQDVKVVKESVKGREIYYKLSGYIRPVEIKNLVEKEIKIAKGEQEFEAVLENRFIKILSVKFDESIRWVEGKEYRSLILTYRLKTTARYEKYIYVDWYDKNGEPIETEKITFVTYERPAGAFGRIEHKCFFQAKSYKLWFDE